MEIDFGGIGKEYAVDRAAALAGPLTERCLLNFGGDLRALGPRANGRPWQVGIEAVDRLSTASRVVEVYRGGLATSGDSRRYLLKDGRRYGHILDPTTGCARCRCTTLGHGRRRYLHAGWDARDARDAAGQGCGSLLGRAGNALLVLSITSAGGERSRADHDRSAFNIIYIMRTNGATRGGPRDRRLSLQVVEASYCNLLFLNEWHAHCYCLGHVPNSARRACTWRSRHIPACNGRR